MTIILTYLLVGAFAGLLAGLFGVGGGAIIVPILIFIFGLQAVDAAVLVHLALGTSFATIVVTSISSILAHHKLRNIKWPVVLAMTPGLVAGVVLCSLLAGLLDSRTLQVAIGIFLCTVALQMGFALRPQRDFVLPGRAGLAGAGGVIGGVSAFFGIGGGSLTVPFLSSCGQPMKIAVACSAACGLPIAIFGALTYALNGLSHASLPAASTGYIYWPAFIGIVIASMPCARLGARLASRLPDSVMQKSFSFLLALIGVRLLFTA